MELESFCQASVDVAAAKAESGTKIPRPRGHAGSSPASDSLMDHGLRTMADSNREDGRIGLLGRMDFKMEVVQTDEATRTAIFCLIPDPRRYEKSTIDGKPHYIDKYLRTAISEELMHQMW